ncbi:MAG TPA: MFS transporter, partial [Rhodospirillaceae bacterium]|nr:MFS transporter [Rhodospirillaceae bacterium]
AFSGAVSLGGVLGALISPRVGVIVDRHGAGKVLTVGTLLIGISTLALSQTNTLVWFYIAFCLGRMAFAGPFEIAVTSSVANWFIHLRGRAMSFAALAHSIGLTIFPIVVFAVIELWDWRAGWIAVGALVLLVGVIPNALLMIQRPEDVGLYPYTKADTQTETSDDEKPTDTDPELSFTRGEASRTRTFWVLVAFSIFIYPVQAGVSLHQAPHLIDRGISLAVAATAVSCFSLMGAIGGLIFGQLEIRFGARRTLSLAALLMALGTMAMLQVTNAWTAYLSAIIFGAGIGGLLTLLPVAWANGFGRKNLGSIRGITLPLQTLAQAAGPLISGVLFDITGSYDASLTLFCSFGIAAAILALFATKPERPQFSG